MKRLYTADKANRTLPYVRGIVREMAERYKKLQELSRCHNAIPRDDAKARASLKEEIRRESSELHDCQEELLGIGVVLKDYETGLVDFPAELNGRPILLCWKLGEESVGHWHETDTGFAGRRPIPAGAPSWPGGVTAAPAAPE
ncbi:MAG: DUF2203 domain-containing protein [Planctomycetota bacterium]